MRKTWALNLFVSDQRKLKRWLKHDKEKALNTCWYTNGCYAFNGVKISKEKGLPRCCYQVCDVMFPRSARYFQCPATKYSIEDMRKVARKLVRRKIR